MPPAQPTMPATSPDSFRSPAPLKAKLIGLIGRTKLRKSHILSTALDEFFSKYPEDRGAARAVVEYRTRAAVNASQSSAV